MNRIHFDKKAPIEVIHRDVGSQITGLGEMFKAYLLLPCPEQPCSQRETRSRRYGARETREPLEGPQIQRLVGPGGVLPQTKRSVGRQAGARPGNPPAA